jgi:hypothetical protein
VLREECPRGAKGSCGVPGRKRPHELPAMNVRVHGAKVGETYWGAAWWRYRYRAALLT